VFTIAGTATALVNTASPASISANGIRTSLVTARVKDGWGHTLTNAANSITFSVSGGPGELLGTTNKDAVSGTATVVLKSIQQAGTATAASTSSGLSQGQVQVEMTAPVPIRIDVQSGSNAILSGGSTTWISASLMDADDTLAYGATNTVSFGISGPGVLLGSTARSASGGIATIVLQSSAGNGDVMVTAESGVLTGGSVAVEISAIPVKLVNTASALSIRANGLTTSLISAWVCDSGGYKVNAAQNLITFGKDGGTLVPDTPVPADGGIATVALKSSLISGTVTVTSTSPELSQGTVGVLFEPGPAMIGCTAQPSVLVADGTGTALITTRVLDNNSSLVATANNRIYFELTGGGALSGEDVQSVNGLATIEYLSGTSVSQTIVKASSLELQEGTVGVSLVAGSPAKVNLNVAPENILSDGVSTAMITVKVADNNGNLITTASNMISFGVAGSGALSAGSVNASGGMATVILRTTAAAGAPGTLTVSAESAGLAPGQADVPLLAGYICIVSTNVITTKYYPNYWLETVIVKITDDLNCSGGNLVDGISSTVNLKIKNHKGQVVAERSMVTTDGIAGFSYVGLPGLGNYDLTATAGGLTASGNLSVVVVKSDKEKAVWVAVSDRVNAAVLDIPAYSISREVAINTNSYEDIEYNDHELYDIIEAANSKAKTEAGAGFNESLMKETLCEFQPVDTGNQEVNDLQFEDDMALLKFPYGYLNENGYIMGVPVNNLKIFLLNEEEGKWEKQEDSWSLQSEEEVRLNVNHLSVYCIMGTGEDMVIGNLMNYPNPFSEQTAISFTVNTNAVISAGIYTLSGRMIRVMEKDKAVTGGYVEITSWDGSDENGVEAANGIYLYKVTAVKDDMRKEAIGRLCKMK